MLSLPCPTSCCCTAFAIVEYLWLNDATSPDGAQEYVVKRDSGNGSPVQIESITFSWCDQARALEHILRTLSGKDDRNDFRMEVTPIPGIAGQHDRRAHFA